MNWSGLQTVLAAQVTTIAGCPVYWRDVTAQWEAWPRVFLSVVSTRKLGQDETRTRYVQVDDVILPRVYGGRVVTVQIQVESRDQNLAASAAAIAEQTRTRLGRLTVLDALRAVDIGVSTTTDIRVVNRTDDKARVVSYAVFEAVLLTHVSDEEDDSADYGYIETAEITQTIAPVQDEVVKTYLVGPQDDPPAPEEDYMASGTYTPTLTPNSGTTATATAAWLWTRVSNGATAAAGDVVRVAGKLAASRASAAQGVIAFTLPFVASPTTSSGRTDVYVLADGAALSALAGLDDTNTGSVTVENLETNALVQVEITYQTANAVDP